MAIDPLKLRQVSVFWSATDEDLSLIARHGIERSIEEGEFFFFQGDLAEYGYVLTSGRAKLTQMNAAGQQVNLRTIHEWEMFGALGAVRENAMYPASAQALEHSTALALKSDFFHEFVQARPHISLGLMQLMTSYIQEIQERYRELATEKVERRLARTLLRLTAQMGIKNADGGIELTFTRQELAEMAGTTLFSASRILSDWEKRGLVESGRERVLIRNPHGLVQLADESGE